MADAAERQPVALRGGSVAPPNVFSRLWKFSIRFARKQPVGALGFGIMALLLFVAAFADLLAPYGINETNLSARFASPSWDFPMGADNLGRDQLSRIIFGARTTVIVAFTSVILALVVGLIGGMVGAYYGGLLDNLIQRFVDAWVSFPTLVLLLTLLAVVGGGVWQIVSVLGLSLGIGQLRVVRASTLSIRGSTYVEAAQALGAGDMRILLQHILPNLFGPVMVLATVGLSAAILTEASLSFLGFGIPPPTASWGRMLSGSTGLYVYNAPWLAIFPGLVITVVVFGLNMFGDALRDELDPRLRGSR